MDDFLDTGQVDTVYNLRVADHHLLRGSTVWAFSAGTSEMDVTGQDRCYHVPEALLQCKCADRIGLSEPSSFLC